MPARKRPKAVSPKNFKKEKASNDPICWTCDNFDPDKNGMWCMVRGRCTYMNICSDYKPI